MLRLHTHTHTHPHTIHTHTRAHYSDPEITSRTLLWECLSLREIAPYIVCLRALRRKLVCTSSLDWILLSSKILQNYGPLRRRKERRGWWRIKILRRICSRARKLSWRDSSVRKSERKSVRFVMPTLHRNPWARTAWSPHDFIQPHGVSNQNLNVTVGSVTIWIAICVLYVGVFCQSQWPRSLRHRSAAARLLRSWVRIPPEAWKFAYCECCVLSGRGLCDELITRPQESYRLWCIVVCDLETSRIGDPYIYIYIKH